MVGLSNRVIVSFSSEIGVFLCILSLLKTVVRSYESLFLVLVFHFEALITDILRCISELMASACVFLEDFVFVRCDIHLIVLPSLIVQTPLLLFLGCQGMLVLIHHRVVHLSSLIDLICKFRVFLRNLDLFLKTLLLVMQLA